MKILAKPIEVLCAIDIKGNITPLRFKMETKDQHLKVMKIDKIIVTRCPNRM